MTRTMVWVAALALGAIGVTSALAQPSPPAGFTALFNGRDLSGWWGESTTDPRSYLNLPEGEFETRLARSLSDIRAHWRVEDGQLINDGDGLYLTTEKFFGDFELMLEYRTVAGADSGVYLRGVPQVQIWDTTEAGGKWSIGADKGSGGLWNNSPGAPGKDPLALADKPFGEWNALRVVMVGERVSVWLNGTLVVDHARLENYFDRARAIPRRGPIQLQTHGGEIRWRNVFVREVGTAEANDILRRGGVERGDRAHGWITLFNGRDFDGWGGPTDGYMIENGAIRCRPGHGGTIYSNVELADFVVQFEFLLPPGGNNGLAIRYPGEGDTAYVGMCELQVLDNTADKYKNLDPRQYHGSAYGMAAAQRGYLRKPGEWNVQEVTVVGSTIRVELNGTRILDTDLSKITDFMYEAEKFAGRTRTSGYFGFAGHNDPVSFREVRARKLGGE